MLFYFIRGFVILQNEDKMFAMFSVHNYSLDSVETALYISIAGFVSMYLGYKVIRLPPPVITNKYIVKSQRKIGTGENYWLAILLFLCWVFITFYKQSLGYTHYAGEFSVAERTSYGRGYLTSLVQTICQFSFNAIIYFYFVERRRLLIFALVLLYMLYNAFSSGGLFPVINLTFTFLTVYLFGNYFGIKRNDGSTGLKKIIILIVISIPLVYISFIAKEVTRFLTVTELTFADLFAEASIVAALYEKISLSTLFVTATSRTHGIDSLAVIVEAKNSLSIDLSPFNFFYLFVAGIIPRFIWHDKPEVSMGQWFTENLWFQDIDATGFQSTAIYVPGDLYLHFGVSGIVIGMFLYGLLLKLQIRYFFSIKNKFFSFLFVSSTLFYFVFYEYTFAGHVLLQIRTFLLLGLFYIMFKFLSRLRFGKKKYV